MISFLIGLFISAAGAVAVWVGTAHEVSLLSKAPTFVEFVGAMAQGAWIGALVFVAGVGLLWVSRALDDRGPVRSYKSPRQRVKAARRPAR